LHLSGKNLMVSRDVGSDSPRSSARDGDAPFHIDEAALGTGDAALAHAASNDRRVGGLPAVRSQDALGGDDAVDVFRLGVQGPGRP